MHDSFAHRGNLAGLRLASFNGEPVQPHSAMNCEALAVEFARSAFELEYQSFEVGSAEALAVGNALRRIRIGMEASPNPRNDGLAFIDFDGTSKAPAPTWLAKGLLPQRGISLLFGESGAGKSFAAVHAALCVAWGLPLFGTKVKRGGVLYIAAEGGRSVERRFVAADGALSSAVAAANICRTDGADPMSRAPIRIVTEAPDLSRDGKPAELVNAIHRAEADFEAIGSRLALVIIDTWHAALGGGDENSAADAGHALKPLITESERGDFLTLIVHHPGKDTERGARGSNALPAAADAIIAVSVPGHDGAKAKPSSAMRRAIVTKMRDGEAGHSFCYRLPVTVIGKDDDGDPVTTCTVEPCDLPANDDDGLSPIDRIFMEAVRKVTDLSPKGQSKVEEARLAFYNLRPASKQDANRQAWGRALKAAIDGKRVLTDRHDILIWLPSPEDA